MKPVHTSLSAALLAGDVSQCTRQVLRKKPRFSLKGSQPGFLRLLLLFPLWEKEMKACLALPPKVPVQLPGRLTDEAVQSPRAAGPGDLLSYSSKCVQCSSRGERGRCKHAAHLNAEPSLMRESAQAC